VKISFDEIKKTFLLALPIGIGQLGHVLTGIADYTMLGHHDSLEMASTTFATSVFFPIMILGMGISIGLTPIVAKANGAKEKSKISRLFSTGLQLNTIIGVILFLGLLLIGENLALFDQDPEVIEGCLIYFAIISVSIIPIMISQSFKQFVEALQDTVTPMYISLFCNVFNIVLNFFLIFGYCGFPEMGIVGAGISTLASRVLMVFIFSWYFYSKPKLKTLLMNTFKTKMDLVLAKAILAIGLPISVYMFFEVAAFSAATFMVGWISKDHMSSHQIALSLASMSFVLAMGIGNAGSIMTATYLGEKKLEKIKGVAISVIMITLSLSLITALIFLLFKNQLPLIFVPSTEELIITQAASMLVLAAIFQFSDGLQVVFQGLLQGVGDVKVPSIIAVFSYWIIGLPLGYWYAFHNDMSAQGVWIGLAIGLTFSAILQILRYRHVLKQLLLVKK
jgi:MATE family multidrug resistance protein